MAYAPVVAPLTQLEAVNLMLASGGEAPVSSLVGQRPDVTTALTLLTKASREVQAEGWRFNTEFGLKLAPNATDYVWTDGTKINVFHAPTNLLSFSVTKSEFQQGSNFLDTAVRPPKVYTGAAAVFYDRVKNRDGFPRVAIFIDPVWLLDFADMPQEARDVITTRAIRYYLKSVVNDAALSNTYASDEAVAMRALKRNHGQVDDLNVFNNYAVSQHRGGRGPGMSGVIDPRGR